MANRVGEQPKQSIWGRIKRLAMTDVGALMRGLNASDLEALERLLIESDFGVGTSTELTEALEAEVRAGRLKTEADLRTALAGRLAEMLRSPGEPGVIWPGINTPGTAVIDASPVDRVASPSDVPVDEHGELLLRPAKCRQIGGIRPCVGRRRPPYSGGRRPRPR